jgi:hypothetical protein
MERTPLMGGWDNFYVIVGSSAAALTGLQFVVITLIGANEEVRSNPGAVRAYGTPTVVHFCAALLVSAVSSAPWHELSSAAWALALSGAGGVTYAVVTIVRAGRVKSYKPVLEDWIWHAGLPLLAYAALLIAALALTRSTATCLFVVGSAALLLLFIGIHNAWDSVTFVAMERTRSREKKQDSPP